MPSLIVAGDATNGVVLTSSNDNALTIQTGAAGAKVNAIALDSSGQATLIQPPKLAASATVSMVQLNTANGFGSTNTQVRRFTNIMVNTGSDITYADSATLGASFTINSAGVYSISFNDQLNAASFLSLSLNATTFALGSTIAGFPTGGAGQGGAATTTMYLASGSVIRALAQAPSGANVNYCQFTITKVA